MTTVSEKIVKKGQLGEYVLNGIYQHYDNKNYYKLLDVGLLNRTENVFLIIYYQCDINGVYISIRNDDGSPKVHQPFVTHETEWFEVVFREKHGTPEEKEIKRFTLIK